MTEQNHHLDTLQDIKQMMERSSRFISLSGLSGIAAGICALAGAWFAHGMIMEYTMPGGAALQDLSELRSNLLKIAGITFIAAFILAFIFTYLRSKKTNTAIWGTMSKRVMINVTIPMIAGGLYLIALINEGVYGYIAPGCLIFYGLAILNASKYTLTEVRYLAYGLLLLGIINLSFIGYGIYFWALGFGVLHIIYGSIMWWKYERK
jgi:hypothetical protein